MADYDRRKRQMRPGRAARVIAALLCAALLCGALCACAASKLLPGATEAAAEPEPPVGVPTQTPHPTATPEPMIAITQPQLLFCIRRTLHESNRSAFTQSELSLLLFMELEGAGLADLSELVLLPALETLVLKDTSVTDLSPLAGVKTLKSLTVENDPALPMAPLFGFERLTQLTNLKLINRAVEDMEAVYSMRALQTLTFAGNAAPEGLALLRARLPGVTITVYEAVAQP